MAVLVGGDGLEGVAGGDELFAFEGAAQYLDGIGGSLERFAKVRDLTLPLSR